MRMMLPTVRERRAVDRMLRSFFATYRQSDFRRAMAMICRFYNLKPPPVEWFEYLDWGKGAGRTYEDGRIHLVHPENWKRGRKYNTMKQWIHTVHHEIGHYVFWTDAERKADLFASGMMHGLGHEVAARPLAAAPRSRIRLTGTRRSVARPRNAS
jgi:hypothetical protein